MKISGTELEIKYARMMALAVSAICLLLGTVAQAQSTLSLLNSTGSSSGDDYEVTGTIGQMEVNPVMSGEDFEATGQVTTMLVTLPTPDGTTLSIAVTSENTIVISWPSEGTPFVLEESSVLGSGNWSTVAGTPEDDGWTKSIAMPVTAGNKFFRLRKP